MFKVLIVDDEPFVCANLLTKIKSIRPHYEIRTCQNPVAVNQLVHEFQPDLLFLDIAMPGLTGFEVLAQIPEPRRNFALVFCTAFDDYALQAFENAAMDYIVKPVELVRLEKTIIRFEAQKDSGWSEKVNELNAGKIYRIIGRKKDLSQIFALEQIFFFTSQDHETIMQTDTGEFFCDLSLQQLSEQLPPEQFMRVHRTYLVNLAMIGGFDHKTNQISFSGSGATALVSKRMRAQFLEKFAKLHG